MGYKVGDKVICNPMGTRVSCGAGYVNGKIFTVGGVTNVGGGDEVLWPDDNGHGVFSYAVRRYDSISPIKVIKEHRLII